MGTGFAPLDAATRKPIQLAIQKLWLAGKLTGVGARLIAEVEVA
jgi:hypothetical protein